MMKYFALALTFCVVPLLAFSQQSAINEVMNDWHDAASKADFDQYFGHFSDSTAIFMGTDATERWDVAAFKAFSKPYFDRGRAWNFKAVSRNVILSEDGNTAWFDEVLDTPNLGPSRGTGVLVLKSGTWKIAHYNLTVPIPNAIMDDVKNQIEEILKQN